MRSRKKQSRIPQAERCSYHCHPKSLAFGCIIDLSIWLSCLHVKWQGEAHLLERKNGVKGAPHSGLPVKPESQVFACLALPEIAWLLGSFQKPETIPLTRLSLLPSTSIVFPSSFFTLMLRMKKRFIHVGNK